MSHTPGPWKIVGGTEIRGTHRIICNTADWRISGDNSAEDDARLIAAAPDLLAAVHGLLASCGPQHESESAEMYQERLTLLQWHIDRASKALTKATGEA